ncbi:hypothetical protein PoB_000404900 [Plakobranchus ocellatus]|uniref:Uncharacterized protein n=1 Tax=Plakobranchus ocellatus TaxID=259542 RepID=A0AAV3Y627_9GAST|nr:hypothetical protein PoB_000404900 [Plakobranchus ocellatus]
MDSEAKEDAGQESAEDGAGEEKEEPAKDTPMEGEPGAAPGPEESGGEGQSRNSRSLIASGVSERAINGKTQTPAVGFESSGRSCPAYLEEANKPKKLSIIVKKAHPQR